MVPVIVLAYSIRGVVGCMELMLSKFKDKPVDISRNDDCANGGVLSI